MTIRTIGRRAAILAALGLAACGAAAGPVKTRSVAVPLMPVTARCVYHHHGMYVLPDRRCTPGSRDPHVTPSTVARTICVRGYTQRVRPGTAYTMPLKQRIMVAYGAKGSPRDYELDHLVPLEGGGAPTAMSNLWPEPIVQARAKDKVENAIRKAVCADPQSLRMLQKKVANDWTVLLP